MSDQAEIPIAIQSLYSDLIHRAWTGNLVDLTANTGGSPYALSPMRGPDRPKVDALPALCSDAQLVRYLDFLLYQEINSVALHGAGIPINVPDPTRYALHKLIVAQMRHQDNAGRASKSRKDLAQAEALIAVLSRHRPDHLKDLWSDLCARGPSWQQKARASLAKLPQWVSAALGAHE